MPSVKFFYLHILNFIHIIVSVYDVPEIRDTDRERQRIRMNADMHVPQHVCGNQRTNSGSLS